MFFLTGFVVWVVGVGGSCGARAVVSGRLGCCGLPGAPAVHGLSFLVVWAAVACWALLRCMGYTYYNIVKYKDVAVVVETLYSVRIIRGILHFSHYNQ